MNPSSPVRLMGVASASRLAVLVAALLLLPATARARESWGLPGSPVHLTVGYQPYYTVTWSGVILRAKKFYQRYLPAGSTVQWELGLHGPVILNAMTEGREDLGYLGGPPAIAAVAHRERADLRLIAVAGTSTVLCQSLLVRADAPTFADADEAVAWLGGKRVAASFGGCSDQFAHLLLEHCHTDPSQYLNLTPTVLDNAFAAHLIDAAAVQEPVASLLIASGLVRQVETGRAFGAPGGAFLVAWDDLIRDRPDIIRAWLNAELDAQLFLAAPENASEIVEIADAQTLGYDQSVLRTALYGGGDDRARLSLPFVFTEEVHRLIDRAALFLGHSGRLPGGTLPPDAIVDAPAREVLRGRGLASPVGEIRGPPAPRAQQ